MKKHEKHKVSASDKYVWYGAIRRVIIRFFAQGVVPMLNSLNGSEYTIVERGLIAGLDAFLTGVIAVATISMLLPLYTLIKLRR